MANKKITELTAVTTLPDAALLTAVDTTRAEGDQNVKITKQNLQTDLGGTQDLQDVTEQGATTDQEVTFENTVNVGNGTSSTVNYQDGFMTSDASALIFLHNNAIELAASTVTKNGVDIASIVESGWNASTNTPTLANTDANKDSVLYPVTVAGTQDFGAGNITFSVGDYVGNINGSWVKVIDNNQSGTPGTDGSSVLSGSVDPTTEGVDGDFYINTTSYEIFGPKASGVWGSGTSLVGPTGANGTLAPWEGEFNREFLFDTTTGLLNQTSTSGSTVFVSNYNDTFIFGGAAWNIIDFDCHQDSSNAINVIYGDFNSTATTTLYSSSVDNLPAIPSGKSRLVLGICVKTGNNDFKLYSKYFRLSKGSTDYYPFDKSVANRDGNLKIVTDIQDISLRINSPDDLYRDGKLVKIRPVIMSNGSLFRWAMYSQDDLVNSIGFIVAETIASQSGVQTLEFDEYSDALGVKLTLTMDFDLFSGTTNYTYNTNWFLDDSVLLEAIRECNSRKTSDYSSLDVLVSDTKQKLNDGTDTNIALFGNSIWTFLTSASSTDNPENLPPSCQTKYMPYQFFNDCVFNKPQYDRFDSAVNTFTESGTFTDGDNFGTASVKYGGALMRYSSTSSAYVEWNWDLSAYRNLNLIFATDDANANDLTVTVSTGTGDVEVYDIDTTSWIEADGYTFDQIADAVSSGNGDAGWSINNRLKFRRVATSGTVTIRIAKGANADVLYYWGTERYNGATTIFDNEGYSANALTLLEGKYNSSLFSKYKDYHLILFEVPLINDTYASSLVDDYHDFIWGDRSGNLNPDSLKDRSTDWADFQVVLFFPPIPKAMYNTNGTLNSSGVTAMQKWNEMKQFVETRGDVPYIDMNAPVFKFSALTGFNKYEVVTDYTTNKNDSDHLNFDGIHMNTTGCYEQIKYIAPIFWH